MQKTISRRPVSSPKMTPRDVLSYFITQRYALLQEHPIHLSTDCMSQKILEILKSLATSAEDRPPSARIKDFIVEIICAEQVFMDTSEEIARSSALNDAVIVCIGKGNDFADTHIVQSLF